MLKYLISVLIMLILSISKVGKKIKEDDLENCEVAKGAHSRQNYKH